MRVGGALLGGVGAVPTWAPLQLLVRYSQIGIIEK